MIDRVMAFLGALKREEVEQLPPVHRQRFAELCRHWLLVAERRREEPKSGNLSELQRGQRQE
jgi:hypothetical protein